MKAALLYLVFIALPTTASGWGIEGHSVVGDLAVQRLEQDTARDLQYLLGRVDANTIAHACYWPDTMRPDLLWSSAAPLHYVNIPRGESLYSRERDCADGRCVTEAIKHFAAQLGDKTELKETRAVAFGWLCHLVGDIHNPMHAGYEDDNGGGDVRVIYLNRPVNLHEFWDGTVIRLQSRDAATLAAFLARDLGQPDPGWRPEMTDQWTNESRSLLLQSGYPDNPRVTSEFAEQTWNIIQQQLQIAGLRLAQILNEQLGD